MKRPVFSRTISISLLLLLVAGCTSSRPAPAPVSDAVRASEAPTNVILFICDGCGPAAYTLARDFQRYKTGEEFLVIDGILTGSVHTYSSSSRVTDSAAGATALASGVKSYNGAIGVDADKRPVATILEGSMAKGMATGLVTTTRITHATPASFATHIESRRLENEIAEQLVESGVDLMLGAGLRHFLPSSEPGSRRDDDRNLIEELEARGYRVEFDRAGLESAAALPFAGLFSLHNLAYAVDDSSPEQPSLAEMTRRAIELLSRNPHGFFLMVEAGRVDHAEHDNDLAAATREMLAYDEAVAIALDFAKRDGQTLIVATADHETGGLSLGRNVDGKSVYAWHPEVVDRVTASHDVMVDYFLDEDENEDARAVISRFTGLADLNDAEKTLLDEAARAREAMYEADRIDDDDAEDRFEDEADEAFRRAVSSVVSRNAVVGWTSLGHTAVDVPLFAFGPGSDRFVGHFDNTHVAIGIADLLDLDLAALTAKLRQGEAVGTLEVR